MKLSQILFSIMFLLPLIASSQFEFDYDSWCRDTANANLELYKKVKSVTSLSCSGGKWTKSSIAYFNTFGLMTKSEEYASGTQIIGIVDCHYDQKGDILKVERNSFGKRESSMIFILDMFHRIINVVDYSYDYKTGAKKIKAKTILRYNRNGTVKKLVKLRSAHDTAEVTFYNDNGFKIKSIWNNPDSKTVKSIYDWNYNHTEMLQKEYEKDSTKCDTIIHKYNNGREIKMIFLRPQFRSDTIYWDYDSKGNLLETNMDVGVRYMQYDENGYLTNLLEVNSLFVDNGGPPYKFYFKCEYDFRK